MELFKRSISLLLVFSLITQSFIIYADDSLPGVMEEEEKPQNPEGTPEGVQCKGEGEKLALGGVCCMGYEVINGYCEQPALVDKSLKACQNRSECGAGMDCLPQTASILFSRLAPSIESIDMITDNKRELEAQVNDVENPQGAGGFCTHPSQCKSYHCVSNKCEDIKVCRMAAEGEVAQSGVNCGPDLVRNMNGICELSQDAKNTVYLGLLKETTVTNIKNCQFELDEATKEKSIVAMKSLRAMEYFLASVTVDPQQECFQMVPKLKLEVGNAMYMTRQNILEMFTQMLNEIETDYATIIAAGEKYRATLESNGGKASSDKEVTIHKDEVIKEGELGSRILSGYDAMMIMYRRNLLFQSYEKAMLAVMSQIQPKLKGLNDNMPNWNDGDSSFNIGDRVVGGACIASKYKKKKRWKWKTKYYESIKDRWAWQYDVSGSAPANADIVKRDKVAKILGLLSGYDDKGTEDEVKASVDAATKKAIADFTLPRFFLMDPLMYGGMTLGGNGQRKNIGSKSDFAEFSGFKDLRNGRYIKGDSVGSFTKMHATTRTNINSFYKALKLKEQKNFIYEPELVTTSAKSCLDSGRTEKCSDFDSFLDDVNDEAFAYFLAYGRHTTDSFSNFFRNATTYRRTLLAKMEVDILNISEYYKTVIKQRDVQNACIEKVMGGLVDSNILVDGSGGLNQGSANKPTNVKIKNGGLSNLANVSVGSKKVKIGKLSPLNRAKFSFDLNDSRLKGLNSKTMLDNVSNGNSSSVESASVGAADAFLAVRIAEMKKANEKAAKAGVNVTGKNKASGKLQSSIAKSSTGSSSTMSSMGSSSLNTAKGALGFGSVGDSSVSKSGVDGSSDPLGTGVNGTGEIGVGNKGAAGAGDGSNDAQTDPNADGKKSLADVDAAGTNGAGTNNAGTASTPEENEGSNGVAGKDGTGLSDDEKDKLLSEAERSKKEYQGSDDDGIFKKVSKAYVRNLDKVLIKKKKID